MSDQFLGRTDLLGTVSSAAAPLVNALTGTPGSTARRLMETTVGIAAQRVLPPYARQRFSTWWKRRRPRQAASPPRTDGTAPRVSVFPTCFVEYMEPGIGRDLVRVFERNGIECSLPEGARCCGAPWLHSGRVEEFERAARRNVAALARAVRAGHDVVVPQPTCAYVIKRDYPLYLPGDEADLVAEHTFDPSEYLMRLQRAGEHPLDLAFPGVESGAVPARVTYHVPCHLRAQNIGLKSRDLLALAGIDCDLVQRCSGIDGTWGYRADHYELARQVAAPMALEVRAAGNGVVCGDCTLANGAILEETGIRPLHPISVLARAYGIAEGDGEG